MSDACYTKRIDEGVYESVVEQLKAPESGIWMSISAVMSTRRYVSPAMDLSSLIMGKICAPDLVLSTELLFSKRRDTRVWERKPSSGLLGILVVVVIPPICTILNYHLF